MSRMQCSLRSWLALPVLLWLMAAEALAAQSLNVRVGQLLTLEPGPIERVAVGNVDMLSTSLLGNGQLLVFGEEEGISSLHIWLSDGRELDYEVVIEGFEFEHSRAISALDRKLAEVRQLLSGVPGLRIEAVGDRIALNGRYDAGFASVVQAVRSVYPEVIDLTLSSKLSEVKTILDNVPGLTIRLVGDSIVLSGEIDQGFEPTIEALRGVYPELLDLTRKDALALPGKQMVLMNIQITEFNTSALESLGINWGSGDASGVFNGPGAGFATEAASRNGVSVLDGANTPDVFSAGPVSARNAFGYFGIATEVTSRLNLAVSSGNAVILAQPRLVARSGGKANFLAGGEVPIAITTPTSSSIEFKQFGILLNISPEVDRQGNIMANVETEISAVDNSVSVGNTPGFLTRRTSADISLKAGDTLVLSGLVNQEISEDVTGIAGLSKIPVLGRLFRSEDFRDRKTELVIFVTPYLYDANAAQNRAALARREQLLEQFVKDIDRSSVEILE